MTARKRKLDAYTLRWVVQRLRRDARRYGNIKHDLERSNEWIAECNWQAAMFLAKAREVEGRRGK